MLTEVVKINTSSDLDIQGQDPEWLGRAWVNEGLITGMRQRFHLSTRRLAEMLGTASQVVSRWESKPDIHRTMRADSAIRLGQLVKEAARFEELVTLDVRRPTVLDDLVPLSTVTSALGLSPSSKMIAEKCRTGQITCYDLGRFGVYLPRDEADHMLRRD